MEISGTHISLAMQRWSFLMKSDCCQEASSLEKPKRRSQALPTYTVQHVIPEWIITGGRCKQMLHVLFAWHKCRVLSLRLDLAFYSLTSLGSLMLQHLTTVLSQTPQETLSTSPPYLGHPSNGIPQRMQTASLPQECMSLNSQSSPLANTLYPQPTPRDTVGLSHQDLLPCFPMATSSNITSQCPDLTSF